MSPISDASCPKTSTVPPCPSSSYCTFTRDILFCQTARKQSLPKNRDAKKGSHGCCGDEFTFIRDYVSATRLPTILTDFVVGRFCNSMTSDLQHADSNSGIGIRKKGQNYERA
jgi:hypothetical protein